MDPLSDLRKQYAAKRSSVAFDSSTVRRIDSSSSSFEEIESFKSGTLRDLANNEDAAEGDKEKEEDKEKEKEKEKGLTPFPEESSSPSSAGQVIAAPLLAGSLSPKPRLSFDKLPRPPQKPPGSPSLKKGPIDPTDRELGLFKDYWADEGSKIFDKWSPPANTHREPEENNKSSSLLSRSLKKILGGSSSQPPKPAPEPVAPQPSEPLMLFDPNYNFLHPDSVDNLVFLDTDTKDGIPIIKGGTLAKLVERLTYDKYVDTNYLQQFLLTYRTFTSPMNFLSLLIERYNVPNPIKSTPEQAKRFQAQKQVVRLRVFNVIKTWLDKHFYDFESNPSLVQDLLIFTETLSKTGMEKSASFLKDFLSRKKETGGSEDKKKSTSTAAALLSVASLSNSLNTATVQLSKLNALEVAKQMTMIEFEIYRAILPSEFTNQGWMKGTKEEKEKNAPNVIPLIERFNQVSNWVATTIIFEQDLETRRDVLVYFIHLANKCRELHNFNAMMEVISGVTSTAIYRLKKTWALVDKNTMSIFEELNTLLSRDNNFANFRKALHKVQPPALPYLGVYLTDMTFVDQGNSDNLTGTQLINFHKRRLLSFVIREIQQYQQLPYSYPRVDVITDYLRLLKWKTEDECYAQSLKIEPREEAPKVAVKVNLPPGYDPPSELEFDYPENFPFKDPDSEDNLTFLSFDEARQRFNVKSATLEKLVERLTYYKYPDSDYLANFLMSFRSFCTPSQLLELLIIRFNTPLPINCLHEDLLSFKEQRLTPIRLRVSNVLKHWIDKHFHDFMEDRSLVASFLLFAKTQTNLDPVIEKTLDQIKKLIHRKLKEQLEVISLEEAAQADLQKVLETPPDERITLFGLQPAEFAHQMALLHKKMYMSFEIVKMLKSNYEFTKDFGPGGNLSIAKNFRFREVAGSSGVVILDLFSQEVGLFHQQFEQIQSWVIASMINAVDLVQRVEVITRFIEMAETCKQLANYFAMAAIVGGLNSPTSALFKKAWSVYPSKAHLILLQDMTALLQKTSGPVDYHFEYLKKVKTATSAVVLHIIPYLDKLTQVTMESDNIPKSNMINFEKRRKIAAILNELANYQRRPYEMPEHLPIQKFFMSLPADLDSENEVQSLAVAANEMDEAGKEEVLPVSGFGKLRRRRSSESQDSGVDSTTAPKESFEFSAPSEDGDSVGKQELLANVLTWHMAPQSSLSSLESDILQKQFSLTEPPEEWVGEDPVGAVLGWPSTIIVKVMNGSDGLVGVKIIPFLTLSELSLVKREFAFYNEKSGSKTASILVVTDLNHISQTVSDLAQANGIQLQNMVNG